MVSACKRQEDKHVRGLIEEDQGSAAPGEPPTTPDHLSNCNEFDTFAYGDCGDGGDGTDPQSLLETEQPVDHTSQPPPEPWTGEGAFVERYPNAGKVFRIERLQFEDLLKNRSEGRGGLYYPFSCKTDLEMATFLHESSMLQSTIDKFLKLLYVSTTQRRATSIV
jgi:hypothetical protein